MSETSKDSLLHYMYEARLYPDEYNSEFSETVKVKSEQDHIAPATPASISAISKLSEITVEWEKPTQNEDGSPLNDLERYKVYRGTAPGFATVNASTYFADTTSYNDPIDSNYGTNFAYRVSAIDYSENESQLTQEVGSRPKQVDTPDLGTKTITETKISDTAVTTPKIRAGAVNATHVAASAITTSKLAANAVVANKMAVGTLSAISAVLGTVRTVNNNFYVDNGGTVYANEFVDVNGESMIAGGVNQTGRILNAGEVGGGTTTAVTSTVITGSWEVPSNKKWVLINSQNSLAQFDDMGIDNLYDFQFNVRSVFNVSGYGGELPSGVSGTNLTIQTFHDILFRAQSGSTYQDYVTTTWQALEVPS